MAKSVLTKFINTNLQRQQVGFFQCARTHLPALRVGICATLKRRSTYQKVDSFLKN